MVTPSGTGVAPALALHSSEDGCRRRAAPEEADMRKVLVVVASRHGATRGIGERIGETLRAAGHEASVVAPHDVIDAAAADAYVIGSGVYMGSWLPDGIEFLERNLMALSTRPVWLFSSGPLLGSTRDKGDPDAITAALGPAEGPGSGGRKAVERLAAVIQPRGHEIFLGAYDPTDPPKALTERVIRILPASKGILPPGDYRDWDHVAAWAREIAAQLETPVPVA
jgi:menaquinone-dependent protoporphyrinogen oxidase